MKPTKQLRQHLGPIIVCLAGLFQSAEAANKAWSTTGPGPADGNFSGINWTVGTTGVATPTSAAATGDALFFDTSSIITLTNDLSAATFAGITFNSGASAYTVGGNAFTLSGALTNNSSSLQTFSNAITLQNPQTITGAGSFSLSGNLTGAGNLTKSGAGTLSLSGATNAISGNLVLSAGRLSVTAGTTNFAGGFSNLSNTASTTAIAGTSSGATLGWTGANGGNFGSAASASGVFYNAGTFNQSATTLNNAGIYLGNSAGSYGYLRNSSTTTISGRLWLAQASNAAGAAGVLDITGGTVSVNPTGNFTAGQRLQINGDGNAHATSTSYAGVNVANGTLTVGGNAAQTNVNTGQNEYTSINITGTGKFTAGNSGTDSGMGLSVTNIATNTATLSIANGGTLETSYIYNNNALGTGVITFDNGTIRSLFNNTTGIIQGTNTKTYIQSGGVTFDTNGFATTVQNPLLAPAGNGIDSITLGGTATGYVGAPVVKISGGGGTGAAAVANFDPTTGTVTGITITSKGSGYTSAPTITLAGGNGGATGAGVGSATATASIATVTGGGLTKIGSGTLTLSAENTYTGSTVVNAGTLTISGGGSINSSSGVNINGSGAKLVQANFGTITPTVTLTNGALDGNGTINTLNVANALGNTLNTGNGAAGALTVGTLTFSGAATLNMRANGMFSDQYFATTDLATSASADVVVNATNSSGFWTSGTVYPVIEFTNYPSAVDASHFTVGTVPGLNPNQTATLVNTGSSIGLSITGESLVWTGRVNSDWTTTPISGNQNWSYLASGIEFSTNSPVLFDDTPASFTSNFTVNIAQNISPSAIVFNNTGSNDYTISSTGGFGITTGNIVKNGDARVTITTANTYTGTTIVNEGILEIGGTGSIATSSSITNNSSLIFNLSGPTNVYANPITGTGSITKQGVGTLTLSGANTFTGDFTLDAGNLNFNSASALGNGPGLITINGGALDNTSGSAVTSTSTKPQAWNTDIAFTGSSSLAMGTGTVTLGGTGTSRTVNVAANTLGVGAITGFGYDLVKTGVGTLQLNPTAASNIGGTLDVSAGTLNIGSQDFTATGLTGSATIGNGSATNRSLIINSAADFTFSGTLQAGGTGTLGLIKSGAGVQTLSNAGTHNTGNVLVNGGTLRVTAGTFGITSISGGTKVDSTGSLEVTGGTLNISGSTAWFPIGDTNGQTSTLTLGGGSVNVANGFGTVVGRLGNGVLNINSGTFSSTDSAPIGVVIGDQATGHGTINLNGGSLIVNLIKGNLGTGSFYFNGGTLKPTAASTTFFADAGNKITTEVRNGGAIVDNSGFNIMIAENLAHSTVGGDNATDGGLTVIGAAITTLSGVSTYTGNTTVNAGTLNLADNAGLKFVIGANGVNNKVTGAGSATLDGDFTFDLTGAAIANGNSWTVVDTTTKSFTANFTVAGFTEVSNVWTKVDGNNTWTFAEADGKLTLAVASTGYAGWKSANAGGQTADLDYDLDGVKNGVEYFMNAAAGFTANPPVVVSAGPVRTVTWTNGGNIPASAYGTQFVVQTSTDLVTWTDVPVGSLTTNTDGPGGSLTYTLTGSAKSFVRLKVTPN